MLASTLAITYSNSSQSGHGSVGRAQPCQGWGRGFEPRCPLHCLLEGRFLFRPFAYRRSGQVVRQRPAKPLPPVRIRASPPGITSGRPTGRPVSFRAQPSGRVRRRARHEGTSLLAREGKCPRKEKALTTGEWLERMSGGAPWGIRTLDLEIRSLLLYPTELMAHSSADYSKRSLRSARVIRRLCPPR